MLEKCVVVDFLSSNASNYKVKNVNTNTVYETAILLQLKPANTTGGRKVKRTTKHKRRNTKRHRKTYRRSM